MNTKQILWLLAVAAVLLSPPVLADPPLSSESRVKALMEMKLDRAKGILEGLTLEDYDKIASNARALKLLSMESGWNVYQTEQYMAQSLHFRQAVEQIVEAAGDKDINRAALGYVALTVGCVECHTYMRKHKSELIKVPLDQ